MADEEAFYAHIAQRLREARAGLKLEQADLASRVGLTQAAISRFEGGDRTPGIWTLRQLADALGKPLSYFLHLSYAEAAEAIFGDASMARSVEGLLTRGRPKLAAAWSDRRPTSGAGAAGKVSGTSADNTGGANA